MNDLLQEAVNDMNKIDKYHRCSLCDFSDNGLRGNETCDGCKYLNCDDFQWHGIKPTGDANG